MEKNTEAIYFHYSDFFFFFAFQLTVQGSVDEKDHKIGNTCERNSTTVTRCTLRLIAKFWYTV